MHLFPEHTVFLQLGPLTITWYALFIITGALIAYSITNYRLKKRGYDIDLSDFFVYMLFIGIAGARVWYCIFMWDLYKSNPIDIFKIYEGGLAIQGGIIAALIFTVFYFKKHEIPFMVTADCAMPTVLIAQAMGRWGNFVNQEAYGQVMSEAQFDALHLPAFIKEGMYINGNYYQPTFLYESVLNIIGFLVIVLIIHRLLKYKGIEFGSYFIWYGIIRFIVEKFRSDSLMLGSLKMAQLTSIAFIVAGLAIWLICIKKGEKYD